jgi:predicted deacylase
MATFTKLKLSGSTDGKAVKVAATATAGTTIHTAHATALDEIWLYAHNSSAGTVKLTLEFGGVAAPDDHIEINIGAEGTGLVLVSPGLLLTNSLVVKAFAATANVVTLTGYVNRIA